MFSRLNNEDDFEVSSSSSDLTTPPKTGVVVCENEVKLGSWVKVDVDEASWL